MHAPPFLTRPPGAPAPGPRCRPPYPVRAERGPAPRAPGATATTIALLATALLLGGLLSRAPAAHAQAPADPSPQAAGSGSPGASDPPSAATGGGPEEALRAALAPYLDAFRQRLFEEARRELDRFWEEGLGSYSARLATRLLWATLGTTVAAWDAVLPRLCFAGWRVCQYTDPALTYANPGVVALHEGLRRATNLALAAVLLLGGIGVAVGRAVGQRFPDASELLPRLAVGALLANTALLWGGWLIELNNALAGAVELADPLPRWGERALVDRLAMEAVAFVVYLVMGVLLLLQNLVRLATLDLLLVTAPPAMLCWVLPLTQRWAERWLEAFGPVVFAQFVQVVVLKLGGALAGAWATGVAPEARGAGAALLWVALLWTAFKVPGLLRSAAAAARPGLVEVLVLRAVTRRLL